MCKLADKVKQPSTWAGFGILASLVGISEPVYAGATSVIMAVAGVLSVVLDDDKKAE